MKTIRTILLTTVLLVGTVALQAQQVNTLYFLRNAPQRQFFNPALMPVSEGYILLPALGYTSLWIGTNSIAISDLVYRENGQTVTTLNSSSNRLLSSLYNSNLVGADADVNILGFGSRTKKNGYWYGGIDLHADLGVQLPKSLFETFMGPNGLSVNLNQPFNVQNLGLSSQIYASVYGGYAREINEHWTVGGKLKVLVGGAQLNMKANKAQITAINDPNKGPQQLNIDANIGLDASALGINLAQVINNADPSTKGWMDRIPTELDNQLKAKGAYIPSGYGAAIDLGFTYTPVKYVQISAALTDLGFIYWGKGVTSSIGMNTTFDGLDIKMHAADGQIDTQDMQQQINDQVNALKDAATIATPTAQPLVRMVRSRLNVGVDAQFWDNRVGVGVLSRTTLYNQRLYEELTLGGFFAPVNWFNLALSYSFINGHWGNIGAGISLAPYDGIMLTLAADYVPTSFVNIGNINVDNGQTLAQKANMNEVWAPYKTPGVNVALGLAIVWGTNKKRDSDKDGIADKWDMCPATPRNVRVDKLGCPIDSDGDGVPDYLDVCPGTPIEAYGMVDSVGCVLDTDSDGVADYLDLCPSTPLEARGSVDENGCARDGDHDGVPDYRDDCPNTLPEAIAYVDEHGCDKDSDNDGVPDYLDKCPNTPAEALGFVDENGCPIDSDNDGVPDYRDQCPNTLPEAVPFIDENGCDKDSDGDGVPDYLDECPRVPGAASNKGCPQIKREIKTILNKAMSGIQFETGKSIIKPNSYGILDKVAQIFTENPEYIVEIQGHTDNVGKSELNMALSDARAQAVRNYMLKKGIAPERMTAHGYGDTMPIADNATKAGRAKNRRVEFKITFEEVKEEMVDDLQQDAPVKIQETVVINDTAKIMITDDPVETK